MFFIQSLSLFLALKVTLQTINDLSGLEDNKAIPADAILLAPWFQALFGPMVDEVHTRVDSHVELAVTSEEFS